MQIDENWHVNAPWAQLVCTTKVPDDLFQKIVKITDEIYDDPKHDSAGVGLAGQIQEEYYFTDDKLVESGLMEYFIQMTTKYWNTVLSNGNMIEHLDQSYPGGPHGNNWAAKIVSCWTVHQFENEFNPIHAHSNCKVSAVLHIKYPENTEPPIKPLDLDGNLIFTGMGAADPFSTSPIFNVRVEKMIGWLHIFPSTLGHSVYPFKGKGERRSLSFNADMISMQELETIKKMEKQDGR